MIGNSEDEGIDNIQSKEEGSERSNNEGRIARTTSLFSNTSTSTSNSSRQWSAFRNPRIVRVSRTFGGKDRHSKVCTIRGLRDRRIRLSVPTAVQLYDLQDKLGLGQPSKAIDWLLDAAKEDIDSLPPLQLPQGFGHHHFNPHQMLLPGFHEPGLGFLKDGMLDHSSFLSRRQHGININESYVGVDHHECDSNSPHDTAGGGSLTYSTRLHLGSLRMTQESSDIAGRDSSKGKWVEANEGQSCRRDGDYSNSSQQPQVSAQNFFPCYSLSGMPSVNPMLPYGYNTQWEPSSLSLSRFGSHGLQFQSDSPQGSNPVTVAAPRPSSSSELASRQQMYFCPPSYAQQMGHHHLQMPSSLPSGFHLMSPGMKPFQANIGSKYYHREDDDDGDDQDEDDEDEDGD